MAKFWKILPVWKGQDIFVLCGGPSVTFDMLEALKGRNVIAINRMYLQAPWAPILFFADKSFWRHEWKAHPKQAADFKGHIYSISGEAQKFDPRVRRLKRVKPPHGLAEDPDTVCLLRTSAQGGMNIAYHMRPQRLILVGMDNTPAPDGRIHCHSEYPWNIAKIGWRLKRENLALTVEPLKKAGIEVINCSLVSTLPWWPKCSLFEVIK